MAKEPGEPQPRFEEESGKDFGFWDNAYRHPGEGGEGSEYQHRALEEMARTAQSLKEKTLVYEYASGWWSKGFPGYHQDFPRSMDEEIARNTLNEIEKSDASNEEWKDLWNWINGLGGFSNSELGQIVKNKLETK